MSLAQLQPIEESDLRLPMVIGNIPAGRPEHNYDEFEWIDLNDLAGARRDNTLMFRVRGDSMRNYKLHHGDIVLADRGRNPKSGDVVIAAIDGEHTVKEYRTHVVRGRPERHIYLVPHHDDMKPREITEYDDFRVEAVVYCVMSFK